jgi:uncharacterized LabA/DUF88 family protein
VAEERLKIAVFVDFDNIEIGVKTTLGVAFDVGTILDAIKERGEVVTKIAYGDWTRAGDYSRLLTQHAIKMVQRNLTPGGDKNGADINLALDALEMALTHDHINAYVIVGGDSDFLSLVEKLKQYDKTVLVVGGRAFTSIILQRNCHEFIAYENLVNTQPSRRQQDRGGRSASATPQAQSIAQALPLVRRALKVLSEREVTPQLGLLKSTLLQLDSTFSEKTYGAGSFRDFAEKLAQAGLLRLNQAGRNLLVELKEADAGDETPEAPPAAAPVPVVREAVRDAARETTRDEEPAPAPLPAAGEALAAQQAEAIGMLRRAIEQAQMPLRWPMYVRNVKQLMRQAESGFDERRYGFGGIIDLLRAAQRDGLLRLERDRQGVLRVFPGPVIQKPVTAQPQEQEPQALPLDLPGEADVPVVEGQPVADEPGGAEMAGVVEESDVQPSAGEAVQDGGAAESAASEEPPLVIDAEPEAGTPKSPASPRGRGRKRTTSATARKSAAKKTRTAPARGRGRKTAKGPDKGRDE